MGFTSLAHLIDIDWLHEAYRRTRKDGAAGVDGQTAEDYAANLEGNLRSLLDRAKSGTYRAPPVRRVHIPKAGTATETRPIGIPTFEDKVLQRAVVMVLEADLRAGLYGLLVRLPARTIGAPSAGQPVATDDGDGGGWIVEVDIRKFFDTLDHAHLRELLQRRVRDGVLLRLIGKWLNAGVLEDGCVTYPEDGLAAGRGVSPAAWRTSTCTTCWTCGSSEEVKPRLKGQSFLIRYADDCAPRRCERTTSGVSLNAMLRER